MRKIIIIMVFLLLASFAQAQEFLSYKDVYINDFVGVLSLEKASELRGLLVSAEKETTAEVVFVGVETTAPSVPAEYRTKLFYKYPLHGGFEKKHIIDCMSDIYASPVRGTPIALEGEAIGRAQAGYMFSEDMMFQDKTGFIYLNYESGIPLLGNLFFAWKKVEKLLGLHADVNGWFLRSNTHHLELYNFSVDGQEIQSYNRMWTMIGYGFSALFLTGAFGFLLFL